MAAPPLRLLVCLDGSDASSHLIDCALAASGAPSRAGSDLHLAAVLPPPMVNVPPSPVATAAAVTAVLAAQEQQQRADEARARAVLQAAARGAMDAGVSALGAQGGRRGRGAPPCVSAGAHSLALAGSALPPCPLPTVHHPQAALSAHPPPALP
jgi:hypothetical protein